MKSKQIIFLLSFLIFFNFFIFFSFLVKLKLFDTFDFVTTIKLQNFTPSKLDIFLSFFSLLGSFEITLIFLFLILLSRRRLSGIIILFIFAFSHVMEIIGKAFLNHPGPPSQFSRYNLGFYFPSSTINPGFSYPSGHSMRTTFILTILLFIVYFSKKIKPKIKYFLYVSIFLVLIVMFFSRISLGEHWITDVIGGTFLGTALAFFSIVFL